MSLSWETNDSDYAGKQVDGHLDDSYTRSRYIVQGRSLGLDVSVSSPSRDVLTSRLGLGSVSDHFVSSRRFVQARALRLWAATAASEFLAMRTTCILSTLICGKWHLQMQAILLTPAQVDSLQMDMKTVAQSSDTL